MMDASRVATVDVPAETTGGGGEFPAGLRVLLVDDDSTCLKIVEKMLQTCLYKVTTCTRARQALDMLQKRIFDIVLSDVHMPDIDGFMLLAHIGLKMDLPVIMMSADDGTETVKKGVEYGACDYLIKPIRMKALKNIWQHVVRRKKNFPFDLKEKDSEQSASGEENERQGRAFDENDNASSGSEVCMKNAKKRKDGKEEEDEIEEREDTSAMKKPRVVWSVELHQQFVAAVNQLGVDKAVPKKILELMNFPGLTRENVASHLQKYRLYLKRAQNHNRDDIYLGATTAASYGSMGSIDGLDFHAPSISGQLASQSYAAYERGSRRMSLPTDGQLKFLNYDSRVTQPSMIGTIPGHEWNNKHMNFQTAAVAPRKVGLPQQVLQLYGNIGSHVIQGSTTLTDTLSAARGSGHGQHLVVQMAPGGQAFSLSPQQNHVTQHQTSGSSLNIFSEQCDTRFSSLIRKQVNQLKVPDSSLSGSYITTSYPASSQTSYSSFGSSAGSCYPAVSNLGPSKLAPANVFQEAKAISSNSMTGAAPSHDLLTEFYQGKIQEYEQPDVNLPYKVVKTLGSRQSIDPIYALGGSQDTCTVKNEIPAKNGIDSDEVSSVSQQNSATLLGNSAELKVGSTPELTYQDIPFSESIFSNELMSVIGEQQHGIGLVDSEFNFDGCHLDDIPV